MNIHFDILSSIYDRAIGQPDGERLRQLLNLPATGYLLDAGGGTGRVASFMCESIDHVVICDLSRPMLQQSRIKSGLLAVQSHTEKLPFPDESFERVLVVDALHHFCDQREALRELLRVLKRGGRLVIEEPDINRFAVKLVALAEKLALMGSHFYAPVKIRQIIESIGYAARVES